MKLNTDETTEIDSTVLAEYIIFQAKEIGEWELSIPDEIADEDDPWDNVRLGNVDTVRYEGDGIIGVDGSFTTRVVTDYIRGTWHHPPEVKTANADGWFHIRYNMEDEGWADGGIEVC